MNAPSPHATDPADCALVLTGGGARAAYQVGVLQALAALRRRAGQGRGPSPFGIIAGTSAGALNAAALACGADRFDAAVTRLARTWRGIHSAHVYRADALDAARAGARWLSLISLGWALARWGALQPRALLDNAPLRALLKAQVPLHRLAAMREAGHLRALAIAASGYTNGEHVTFCDTTHALPAIAHAQRREVRAAIGVEHLMASSAIPFVFPAAAIDTAGAGGYYGDGSMRQTAPLAPAIRLGARRILAVGAGRAHEPPDVPPDSATPGALPAYPSLALIAGHALSSIFLDSLLDDAARLERINRTLALVPPGQHADAPQRHVALLLITPSQRLDSLAARHTAELPRAMRALLAALGASSDQRDARSAALASYLLFEPGYTHALMRLGRADTLARQHEVCRFFGWPAPADAAPA
ncbi:MAG: patatin-like phospholipase family protein [Pseudomonadota bacterium]|nr:patatin-like phospholipase family protein [Pseudomonadota bacterium]